MSTDSSFNKAQLVRTNVDKLSRIPQATYAEFAADFRNTEAALHLMQTSIQALIDMGPPPRARGRRSGPASAKHPVGTTPASAGTTS